MADWAIFAHVVGDALDVTDIDELLDTMETERATFALENEPRARVLGEWVDDNPETTATWRAAGDLADRLEEYAADQNLRFDATHPAALGSKLSTYRNEFTELYEMELDDRGRQNKYRFDVDSDDHSSGMFGRYQQ